MIRTQIQLPDELHQKVKRFATDREISVAEIARRGIELFLDRYPENQPVARQWQLPRIDGGGILVPLDQLHRIAADDETKRGR